MPTGPITTNARRQMSARHLPPGLEKFDDGKVKPWPLPYAFTCARFRRALVDKTITPTIPGRNAQWH
jgi:hypothetical protein